MKHAFLLSAIAATALPLASPAQDSPGNLNDGSARFPDAEIRADWSSKPPEVLWRKDIGKGCTSFAIAGDHVLVGGNDGEHDTFWCLDPASGAEKWKYRYKEKLQPKLYAGGPNATPTIDGDRAYILSKTGLLHCVELATGQMIWKTHFKDDLGGTAPDWGYSAAPLVDGDQLLVLPCSKKGSLFALDKKTGKVLWHSTNRNRPGYAQPKIIDYNGTRAGIVFHGRNLVIYDLEKEPGKVLAEHLWRTSYDVNASPPQYRDGLVFIASGYGMGYAVLDVSGDSSKVLHQDRDIRMIFQNSILLDGDILGVFGDKNIDAELIRMDFRSGKIHWREKMPGTRGSSLLVGDHLVALCETGDLIVGKPGKTGWTELGRTKVLDKLCWAPLAYANGRLFARNNDGAAVCLDVSP